MRAAPTLLPRVLPRRAGPVVRIAGLQHYYGKGDLRKQVLFDNHLEIAPGEMVILTGPSGSGKTTLLTLIGGLRTVQEGEVQVLDKELHGLAPRALVEVRRRIGFIFQAHNLFESLTAFQNVLLALELGDLDGPGRYARAQEILEALGLGHRLHYKPEALSGGQRQRVAVARALANRPQLVLADEPTAALDEKSGRDVVQLLQTLAHEEGTTSLIVTHDNRILDVADRIINMVDGRIHSDVRVKESVAICEFLSKCPAFAALTPAALTHVAEKMHQEHFPAGAVILREGDEGDRFCLIRTGSVDVVLDDGKPTRRVTRVLHEGEFFGEIALLLGGRRTATVVAREGVELYTLVKEDFQAALRSSPSFQDEVTRVYFQRQ